MFSRFIKKINGYQETLVESEKDKNIFNDVRDFIEDFEVKSMLSSCQSEVLERQKMKKKSRKTRLRNIFTSGEEHGHNIVLDPWPNTRSVSMVSMGWDIISDFNVIISAIFK